MSRQVGALWNTHGDSVVPYDYVVGYSILCEFVDDAGSVIMSTTDFYLPLGCLISGREILGSKSWPFWRAPPLNQRGFVKPGLEVVLLNDQSELDPLHSGASLLGGNKIWLACWSPAKSWVWGMGKLIYIYIHEKQWDYMWFLKRAEQKNTCTSLDCPNRPFSPSHSIPQQFQSHITCEMQGWS